METLRTFLKKNQSFTALVSRLTQTCPGSSINNKVAGEYIIGLNDLSTVLEQQARNLTKN